jgi:hypothetical protein
VKAGWLLAASCALAVAACSRGAGTVPPTLLGRWTSRAPAYAGRTLLISSRSLVFASSETASENYAVRGVETHTEQDGSLAVTIEYGTREDDRTLRIRRYETRPPSLTLGDRSERWILAPGSGRLP